MIMKAPRISQTRIPSSFSIMGGETSATETKNSVSSHFWITNTLDNLAALDGYVTIQGPNKYQKTYQDKMDVNCL